MTDDEFACTQNISRFADQLQEECEPRKRTMLNRLLIEEEDHYAALSSRRDFMMRKIVEVDQRIVKQQALLREIETRGMDGSRAATTLNYMVEIRNACASFCNRLIEDERRTAP